MALDHVAPAATRVLQWTAIALGVSIPVSTALDNILLGVALIAWMLCGSLRDTLKKINKIKYLQISLGLFGVLALGTLYGKATLATAFATLNKYADLLCIPIFAIAFRDAVTRRHALHAFAATIAVVIILSTLISLGWIAQLPFFTGTAAMPTVFKLKITHSVLAAFGAFLFVWLGNTCGNTPLRWVWYGFAVLAAVNVLLLVQGATGYVTLAALLLLLGYQRLSGKGFLLSLLALAAATMVLVSTPTAFRERVSLIHQEMKQWRPDEASQTSTGLRLEFYHNTLDIIAAHPLAGVGTGGFSRAYAQQVQGSGKAPTHNPHNEFLHIAAQTGVVGLFLLIALFWTQWRSAPLAATPMEQSLMRALILTMVAGCMVNSLLLDHAEGLFYAWLSGMLAGGLQYKPSFMQSTVS